uniref:Acyl-CoA binding domain containing 4 n=1 Tax=Athene cunicularia TaxID=194338 RepID=A0A663MVX7_ATHCN
ALGPCPVQCPGDIVPVSQDAWHSLGRMSKEEAMAAYVAEMKKVAQKVIIDTVPMDETTEEMFGYFEPLYEVIRDMPRPPEAFFKKKGGEWEPLHSPAAEPCASLPGAGLAPATEALEGSQVTSDSEGDVYCDTLEQMEPEQVTAGWEALGSCRTAVKALPAVSPALPALYSQALCRVMGVTRTAGSCQWPATTCLSAGGRGGCLVTPVTALSHSPHHQSLSPCQAASPWPLTVSPHTLLFLLTWPFVTQWLLRRWQGTKR